MNSSKILIIDDEEMFREDLAIMLRRAGYHCDTAENAEQGIKAAQEASPDIILSDIVMPDKLGTEILPDLQAASPGVAIIMLTAFGDLESALQAFRLGAVDYLLKPISRDELLKKIGRLDEQLRLTQEVSRLRKIISGSDETQNLIGDSPSMVAVKDQIERVAGVDTLVLITGESGTGKEVVAKELHRMSERSEAPFLAINCGAIPDQLLESELFGHVKGAFTGATAARMGFFELAGEGTLLLDEIGDMPLNLQTKLLRALEEKEFYRVGSTQAIPLKARVVSSTNRILNDMVAAKTFREDLFYRINVFEIKVPPLRERKEDIPKLVDFFIKSLNEDLKRNKKGMSTEAFSACMNYAWPGNIRQLKNILERAIILSREEWIQLKDLPPEIHGPGRDGEEFTMDTDDIRQATHAFEKKFIERIIQKCGGNREQAAEKMGINPSTLYRKMKDIGLMD
jgi:two-component system response regulator HydG